MNILKLLLNQYKYQFIGVLVLLVVIIIVVVVVTSKKGDNKDDKNDKKEVRKPKTHSIVVKDGSNLSLTIKKGDTIVWTIHWPHYLSGSFKTPAPTSQGVKTHSVTFNEDFPGSTKKYEYRSAFRSSLNGTIIVEK